MVVDQIEEAKRLIGLGGLSNLRMALLLLDNASEVLMYRVIRNKLLHREMEDRITASAKRSMPPHVFEEWKGTWAKEPMSRKARNAIEKTYDAKVDFLIEAKRLGSGVGRVLKAIHRYRNEAYHRDKVRKETIGPAVMVLFGIVTDLLPALPPGMVSLTGGQQEYAAFRQRYKLDHEFSLLHGGLEQIRDELQKNMPMAQEETARDLAEHLLSRLDDLVRDLGFVQQSSAGEFTLEQQFARMQLWKASEHVAETPNDQRFKEYVAPRTLRDIERWRLEAQKLSTIPDRLKLLGTFAALELEMEPMEELADEIADHIHHAIDMQIDILRGK
jgi:hypothetical protein